MSSKNQLALFKTLAKIEDPTEVEEFLSRILTPSELTEIPQRLQIFALLDKGMSQREIARQLNVAIATVSRGAKEYKYSGTNFSKFLKEL